MPGKPSASPFVYTTGDIHFPNPLLPTLDTNREIDISTIGGSGNPPSHVTRSLEAQLQALFGALLAELDDNEQHDFLFQVEIQYDYRINEDLDPVPLPLLMQAPLSIQLQGSGAGSLAQMIAEWTGAIQLWFQTNCPMPADPVNDPGTLMLDLTAMTTLTRQPMPMLRLRQLVLPLLYVTDLSALLCDPSH